MNQVAANIEEARLASFRQAERDMQPLFNRQARAAAGGDRRLRNARGAALTANFLVEQGSTTSLLRIRPSGPWGIRDNTDTSGPTAAHTIAAKRAKRLKFMSRKTGKLVYAKSVWHPGSARGRFWGSARDDAFDRIRKQIPEEVKEAINSALSGSGFKSRR